MIAPKYCILDSCWLWGLLYFFQGILAHSSRYNVIWIKSSIPVHFSSFIPQTLMFTLSISCLITSNLPWFMDLTIQVPMHYCSLRHQTLLLPSDPFTTGHISALSQPLYSFCSYFSPLFLWHIGCLLTWKHHLSGSYLFCPFILFSSMLKWFAIPFTSGAHFVRILRHDLSIWAALHGMAHSFMS